jgi:hypothetical protein
VLTIATRPVDLVPYKLLTYKVGRSCTLFSRVPFPLRNNWRSYGSSGISATQTRLVSSHPTPTQHDKLSIHSERKQSERASKIATLPKAYLYPLSPEERTILGKPIQDLVQDVHKQVTDPVDILRAYGKVTLKAQEKTNCVTEILFPEAEEWAQNEINLKGPLAGIPVSLKDSIQVKGFDISIGFSGHTGKPYAKDGPLVQLLKEAGRFHRMHVRRLHEG